MYYSILEDRELVKCFLALPDEECYLNLPAKSIAGNSLNIENIHKEQYADDELLHQKNIQIST